MNEKQNAIFTIGFLFTILLVFTVADFVDEDRVYSETENRILASKPDFSKESLFSGEYTKDYEEYVTDQFISRDKWIGIKTNMDILLQKKDINGVYLGKDGYLIEKHDPEDYTVNQEVKKAALLNKLVKRWDAKVMLVPTADNILTDKMPDNAVYYDQTRLLEQVKSYIGEDNYIDVYSVMQQHVNEEIYYRTDHHWTSLGAYYGYQAWAEKMNKIVRKYKIENMQTATEEFLGTLHSKVNITVNPDKIQYFPITTMRPVSVTYDFGRTEESFYSEKYLETKNKYGFFLDDNHAFVEIKTSYHSGKTLFLIKDSYANSMIPLLAPHYETIYVVDLRYFNGKLNDFMERYEPKQGMDVLILYNCIHFLEDFQYYE